MAKSGSGAIANADHTDEVIEALGLAIARTLEAIGIEAESAEEAREKGRGLAQMALDRLEHDYDVNAYPYDEYADEIAFEEEDLKG